MVRGMSGETYRSRSGRAVCWSPLLLEGCGDGVVGMGGRGLVLGRENDGEQHHTSISILGISPSTTALTSFGPRPNMMIDRCWFGA